MPQAAIFDIDGTMVDSVDLHALAWHRAFDHFGHDVSFEQARSQIGKGGDKLLTAFLSEADRSGHGDALEKWRGDLFRAEYLSMVRPFSAVAELLRLCRESGLKVAAGSSAKQRELTHYLKLVGGEALFDVTVSSDDVKSSKPDPDVFDAALGKLGCNPADAVVIGDSPYDAIAAIRAGASCIGVLSGGFTEPDLREAGATAVYPSVAALWAVYSGSPLAT